LLPLLEPEVPQELRERAIEHIGAGWKTWERSAKQRPEWVVWARRAELLDDPVREIALRLLSIVGDSADASRWRPVVERRDVPARVLAAAVRLVGRFGVESDLPAFRALVEHSPEVGCEAVAALARVGGAAVLDELVQIVNAPPAVLEGRPWFASVDWRQVVAQAVIRFGNGEQAKRIAKETADIPEVAEFALRHARLPEHLFFLSHYLSIADSRDGEDDYSQYGTALRKVERVMERVGAEEARRVLIEAVLWDESDSYGHRHSRHFEDLVDDKIQPEDAELILRRLRTHPNHLLALGWLVSTGRGEEELDAIWRERAVPWWTEPSSG
jgi:hypothetical protein